MHKESIFRYGFRTVAVFGLAGAALLGVEAHRADVKSVAASTHAKDNEPVALHFKNQGKDSLLPTVAEDTKNSIDASHEAESDRNRKLGLIVVDLAAVAGAYQLSRRLSSPTEQLPHQVVAAAV